MSFVVHPQQEDFLTKIARGYSCARGQRFWPRGASDSHVERNGRDRRNKQTNKEQTNKEQTNKEQTNKEQTNKVARAVRINVSCCSRSDKLVVQMKAASQGAATP